MPTMKTKYGLNVLNYLAGSTERPVLASRISEQERIPADFLAALNILDNTTLADLASRRCQSTAC